MREHELPAPFALAGSCQILELEVIQQVEAHCVQRERVNREVDPLGRARSGVVVAV